MSTRQGMVLSAGLLALFQPLPTRAAMDDEAAQVREQCEAQPEIKSLHFGARKDALKKCIDAELDKRHAEREAAHQAELAKLSPVHRYAVCTDRTIADLLAYEASQVYQIQALHGDASYTHVRQEITDMKSCLDTKLPVAIAQASEAPDLTKAIKDYYVAAESLLDSVMDDKAKRAAAGQSYDEANNRLHMEAAAAGKW